MFITFEGGEGSGKTTQAKLLHKYLVNNKKNVAFTREPGGKKESENIRELLLRDDLAYYPISETLLFFASRYQNIKDTILPKLEKNYWVICDRFIDSTIAYQHYGMGVELKLIEDIAKYVIGNLIPDITFLLDIDHGEGLVRAKSRQKDLNEKYENKKLEFHKNVRYGFNEIYKNNPKRIKLIDATLSEEIIHQQIIEYIQDFI